MGNLGNFDKFASSLSGKVKAMTPEELAKLTSNPNSGFTMNKTATAPTMPTTGVVSTGASPTTPTYGSKEYFDNLLKTYQAGTAGELSLGAQRTRNLTGNRGTLYSTATPRIYSQNVEQPYQASLQKLMGQEVSDASKYFSKEKPYQEAALTGYYNGSPTMDMTNQLLPYLLQGYITDSKGGTGGLLPAGFNYKTESQLDTSSTLAKNLGFPDVYTMSAYATANPDGYKEMLNKYLKSIGVIGGEVNAPTSYFNYGNVRKS